MAEKKKRGDEVMTSVRLPAEMVEWIEAHAADNVRSRAQEIEYLLRKAMQLVKDREARESAGLESDLLGKQVGA